MALSDYRGKPVLHGTWKYGDVKPQRVTIVASDHDVGYRMLKEFDGLRDGDEPRPLGPDGYLYYVANTSSPGHRTLEEAKAWANQQPWGPVAWDAGLDA